MLPGLPANTHLGGRLVHKLAVVAAVMAVVSISACKKTGAGEYQVEKPVVGTQTDTVHTPSVETGTVKDTLSVPEVKTKKKEMNLPKVEVKTPEDRKDSN